MKQNVSYVIHRGRIYADAEEVIRLLWKTDHSEAAEGLEQWLQLVRDREKV